MTFETVFEEFVKRAGNIAPLGKKLKIVLDDQPILIDGTGEENNVTGDDGESDTTINMTLDTFKSVMKGDTNPMMAVMTGKIKVKGDMGLAMKLQNLM